ACAVTDRPMMPTDVASVAATPAASSRPRAILLMLVPHLSSLNWWGAVATAPESRGSVARGGRRGAGSASCTPRGAQRGPDDVVGTVPATGAGVSRRNHMTE